MVDSLFQQNVHVVVCYSIMIQSLGYITKFCIVSMLTLERHAITTSPIKLVKKVRLFHHSFVVDLVVSKDSVESGIENTVVS